MESFLLLLLAQAPVCTFSKCSLSLSLSLCSDKSENGEAYQRKKAVATGLPEGPAALVPPRGNPAQPGSGGWRRIALLILAITIHNIPGEALPPRGPTVARREGHCQLNCLAGRGARTIVIWILFLRGAGTERISSLSLYLTCVIPVGGSLYKRGVSLVLLMPF